MANNNQRCDRRPRQGASHSVGVGSEGGGGGGGRQDNRPKDDGDQRAHSEVWLGGLHASTPVSDIQSFMEEAGSVNYVKDMRRSRNMSCVFVHYHDAASAHAAVYKLHGRMLDGAKVRIEISKPSERARRDPRRDVRATGSPDELFKDYDHAIQVLGLPRGVEWQEVKDFGRFKDQKDHSGRPLPEMDVCRADVWTDFKRNCVVGFINYKNERDRHAALMMFGDSSTFEGHPLAIYPFEPRPTLPLAIHYRRPHSGAITAVSASVVHLPHSGVSRRRSDVRSLSPRGHHAPPDNRRRDVRSPSRRDRAKSDHHHARRQSRSRSRTRDLSTTADMDRRNTAPTAPNAPRAIASAAAGAGSAAGVGAGIVDADRDHKRQDCKDGGEAPLSPVARSPTEDGVASPSPDKSKPGHGEGPARLSSASPER